MGSATAGYNGRAIAGLRGRARAKLSGEIWLTCYDLFDNCNRMTQLTVGENGIDPDIYYTLDSNGKPRKYENSKG